MIWNSWSHHWLRTHCHKQSAGPDVVGILFRSLDGKDTWNHFSRQSLLLALKSRNRVTARDRPHVHVQISLRNVAIVVSIQSESSFSLSTLADTGTASISRCAIFWSECVISLVNTILNFFSRSWCLLLHFWNIFVSFQCFHIPFERIKRRCENNSYILQGVKKPILER